MNSFKSVILLLLGLATLSLLQYRAHLKLQRENTALRQQISQLAQAVTNNRPLSTPSRQDSENSSLSNDQFRELLRLRGEVALFRSQQKESPQPSDNSRSARTQYPVGAGFTPDGKLIATNLDGTVRVWDLSTAQEVIPKEKWTFSGYSDPESTLKTLTWAMSKGDLTNMIASVTQEEGANITRDLGGKSEAEIASELSDLTGVRIIKKDIVSEDEVVMTLFADGKDEVVRLRFQRFGNDWKMAGKAPRK